MKLVSILEANNIRLLVRKRLLILLYRTFDFQIPLFYCVAVI